MNSYGQSVLPLVQTVTTLPKAKIMKTKPLRCTIRVIGMLGVLQYACISQAATRTWDGGGTNNNWTTATNWVGDTSPVAGDDLVFPLGAAGLSNTNNFAAATVFNSITI